MGKLCIDTVLFLHISTDFPQASSKARQFIHILHGLGDERIHNKLIEKGFVVV